MAEQRYKAVMAVISEAQTITQVARGWGVSRQTLHAWLARYEADGLEGLANLSRRPAHCDLPIDKNRIFVAGLSGGHMAYTLACAIPERIASIASISGGMPVDDRKAAMRCSDNTRAKPVSVMEMHGTADTFMP